MNLEKKDKYSFRKIINYSQKISDAIGFKRFLNEYLFNAATGIGKLFEITLMLVIMVSIATVILHSMPNINTKYNAILYSLDWFFTVCFLIEYCLRVYAAPDRRKYIFSFFGIIDFLAVFPSVMSLIITGKQTIQVVRIVRLLRVFKVLRLFRFVSEAYALAAIMRASLHKIAVFMTLIFIIVVLLGSGMYIIESGTPGFNSIPACIYWGIVTITTVGFGDITPATPLGKFIASVIMLAGYAIIAVPTAIWSFEIAKLQNHRNTFFCKSCGTVNDKKQKYCGECGCSFKENTA